METLPTEVEGTVFIVAKSSPSKTVLRIWDCFFNEGPKILFRVALTLLHRYAHDLRRCKNMTEFARVFERMGTDDYIINCHQFMQATSCLLQMSSLPLKQDIFTVPGNLPYARIERLRVEIRPTL